jgi:hypothetical protein
MKQLVLLSKQEYEGLKHHGVIGMKWGVRNDDKPSGGTSRFSKKSQNGEKKKASEMSTAELRRANERMRLENEYKRLLRESKAKPLKQRSDNVAKNAIDESAKKVITRLATGLAVYVFGNAINERFGTHIKF